VHVKNLVVRLVIVILPGVSAGLLPAPAAGADVSTKGAVGTLMPHEVRVNTYLPSVQENAGIAGYADGGLVLVWDSRRQEQGNYGVYLQRFGPDGSPIGGETHVNVFTDKMQSNPAVAVDGLGGTWVAWESFGQDGAGSAIIARRFSPDFTFGSDEILVNRRTAGTQHDVVIAGDAQGGATLIWVTPVVTAGGSGPLGQTRARIVARRFGPEGGPWGDEFFVSTRAEDTESLPTVAQDEQGRLAVVWAVTDGRGEAYAIRGRILQTDGTACTPVFTVSEADGAVHIEPAVAATRSGEFVVAWLTTTGEDYVVSYRRITPDGCAVGPTHSWQDARLRQLSGVAVAGTPGGGWCMAVNAAVGGDDPAGGIYARCFGADGQAMSDTTRVNRHTDGVQRLAVARGKQRLTYTAAGRLAVAWAGDCGSGDAEAVNLTVLLSKDDIDALQALLPSAQGTTELTTPTSPIAKPHEPPIRDPSTIPAEPFGGDPEPFSRGRDLGFIGVTNTGWTPPDPHLAVGPQHLALVTNGAIAFYQKDGTLLFQDELEDAYGFWGVEGATGMVFDPEVLYDPHSNRFMAMACERTNDNRSKFLLAVSSNADPMNAWHRWRFDVTALAGNDIDSPNLAVDAQAVYLSSDHFSPNKYLVYILDKASVLSGGTPTPRSLLVTGSHSFGLPVTYDADAPAQYMIEAFESSSNSTVRFHAITDPLGTPQRVTATLAVPTYTMPEDPPQKGTSIRPEVFEARFWSCVYRNGSLWAVHHHGSSRVRARWYEFAMNNWPVGGTPELVQYGEIDPGTPVRTFFPSIWVDNVGNAAIVCSRSSAQEYISIWYAVRLAGDPPGTFGPLTFVKSSSGPYTFAARWGDYSGTSDDPAQPGAFWFHHEYAPTSTSWNTWIAQTVLETLQLEMVDPAPVPTLVPPGTPLSVTLRITEVGQTLVPGSAKLYYRFDESAPFEQITLTDLGEGLFQAAVPGAACGQTPQFAFGATGNGGSTVYEPADFPAETFSYGIGQVTVVLDDDFETDHGWTATYVPDGSPVTGFWERVEPIGTTAAPSSDFSGAGTYCYVTQNGLPGGGDGDADVDNGTFILTSPTLAMPSGGTISYARWFYWHGNGTEDFLDVELSNDDGGSWALAERVSGITGWVQRTVQVEDYVSPSATVRIRFVTSDVPSDSLTEAAVDEVVVQAVGCLSCPFPGDNNGDCHIDLADFSDAVGCLSGPGVTASPACGCFDFNDDDSVDLLDLAAYQNAFTGPAATIPGCR